MKTDSATKIGRRIYGSELDTVISALAHFSRDASSALTQGQRDEALAIAHRLAKTPVDIPGLPQVLDKLPRPEQDARAVLKRQTKSSRRKVLGRRADGSFGEIGVSVIRGTFVASVGGGEW